MAQSSAHQSRHDNSALVFSKTESEHRFSGIEWVHVKGTGRALPKAPRVNIEVKAKYKDSIKKFFEWGMTMSPLMRDYTFALPLEIEISGGKNWLEQNEYT